LFYRTNSLKAFGFSVFCAEIDEPASARRDG
jgi:hypothetical protein